MIPITLDSFGWTGLVGTLGFTVYNADGTEHQARTNEDILEIGTTGVYVANVAESLIAGRVVVWDTDNGAPVYGTEAFPSNIAGYTASATTARSIKNLAWRAYRLYGKVSVALYADFLVTAYQKFVTDVGGIYPKYTDLALVSGTSDYALPGDYRALKPNGIWYVQGTTSNLLALASEAASLISVQADTDGTPGSYALVGDRTIRLLPAPNAAAAASASLRLYYDADCPTTLTATEDLPMPSNYERALLAYAIMEAALIEADWPRYGVEKKRYEDGITQYRTARAQRAHRSYRITPRNDGEEE